ncbi:hypothetical protein RIR_jg36799.t1 [Rhizophagus irregularis DAOM 181602=DAOM 197198]|nr:hypothetical protein RIR_jg36799.t1 [Rhizophagus irregularis DAOM 181602=DAOM 197198]
MDRVYSKSAGKELTCTNLFQLKIKDVFPIQFWRHSQSGKNVKKKSYSNMSSQIRTSENLLRSEILIKRLILDYDNIITFNGMAQVCAICRWGSL